MVVTGPVDDSLGSAYVRVVADTSDFNDSLERGVERAGKDAEPEAEEVGEGLGKKISEGVEREVGKHGPEIGRSIGEAVEREEISVRPRFRYNVRGRNGRFVSRAAAGIQEEVEQAFAGAVQGGIFATLRQAIADAIGAGFNISGRSPLVALLIPVIGAIVGLVLGLLQVLNAAAAVLAAFPSLMGAILFQAGVLVLAFQGIGTAVSGAFAATNARELNEALKDLTPSAQAFVRTLLPLKPLFEDLQDLAQENFFKALGTSVADVISGIAPQLRFGVAQLGTGLGKAISDILAAFESPQFKRFLDEIVPATTEWLRYFGPAFSQFLIGLIAMATAATPFLNALGGLLNELLVSLGGDLFDLGKSRDFTDWLNSMVETVRLFGSLLKSAFRFLVVFLAQLDAGGGDRILTALIEVFDTLSTFFASPVGLDAIRALVSLSIFSIQALTGVIIIILGIIGILQNTWDFLGDVVGPGIAYFFSHLGGWIVDFFKFLWNASSDFLNGIIQAIRNLIEEWIDFFHQIWIAVTNGKGRLILLVTQLPGQIKNALGNMGKLLLNAGKDLLQGLIDGIKSMIPSLQNALGFITNMLPDWKGPEEKDKRILEPAGRAVMQGFGEGLRLGALDIATMLGDYTSGLGVGVNSSTTNFTFGQNSIHVAFSGALPTQQQALQTGASVGSGIANSLAARNTRLAVRTL